MATKIFSLKEVGEHRGRDSCWIVIDGKVYDVTKYLDQHPGGEEEILNEAGTNATQAFNDVGHSSDAKEILKTLIIGNLHPDDLKRPTEKKDSSIPWVKIATVAVVPLTIAVITAFILFVKK